MVSYTLVISTVGVVSYTSVISTVGVVSYTSVISTRDRVKKTMKHFLIYPLCLIFLSHCYISKTFTEFLL